MLEWLTKGMIKNAPRQFAEGLVDVITAPPKKAVELWEGIPEKDQELFKEAAYKGLVLAAKMLIKYADKGKISTSF